MAEPITMLQIDNVSPFEFRCSPIYLGPARMDSPSSGSLAGQLWVYNPSPQSGLDPTTDRFLLGPGSVRSPHSWQQDRLPAHSDLEFGMGGDGDLRRTWTSVHLHEFFRSYYGHM